MRRIRPISAAPAPAFSFEDLNEFIDAIRNYLALLEELNMVLSIGIPEKGR